MVSYADHLTKFKLVSGLVDTKIKEDLGGEEKTLENTVKAVEAMESAKCAKVKLGRRQGQVNKVNQVKPKTCFSYGGTNQSFVSDKMKKSCTRYVKFATEKDTSRVRLVRY